MLVFSVLVVGCEKGVVASPKNISAGDTVVLAEHALACKQPSGELARVAASENGTREDLLAQIRHKDGCYDSSEFRVNDHWQVLAVNGTELHIQMRGYVGDYWVSQAQVVPDAPHAAAAQVVAQTSMPVTLDEWRKSLKAAYEETQVKQSDDGKTTFMAMFPKKGGVGAFGEHDAFNKAYIYKPFRTQLDWDLGPGVRSYVLVPDGGSPVVVISPLFWGRDGYISLRKMAILVDGELLFEKDFEPSDVKRGRYGAGVNETADIILSGDALRPLRKITKESKIAIRLTGERAYVNLKKDGIDPVGSFKDSIIESLFIYDSIERATAGHMPDRKTAQL